MCGVARTVGRKLLVLKRLVSKFQFSKRERISRISKILSCLELEFRKFKCKYTILTGLEVMYTEV